MSRLIVRLVGVLAALVMLMASPACGKSTSPARQVVGVSMAYFDDNFLTILRTAMADYAVTFPEIVLQFTDAQGDVGKQLSQIQNFVAAGRCGDYRECGRHLGHAVHDESRTRGGRAAGVCQSPSRRGDAARRCRVRRFGRTSGRHAGDGRTRPIDEPPRERRRHDR